MKKNISTTEFTALIILCIIFMTTMFFVKNSSAISLVVDQNVGEIDTYDFDFIPITENTLSFDFTFTTVDDPLDPDDSWFLDSFYCNIIIGAVDYGLLLVDDWGNLPDPDWTAPSTVTVSASTTPGYDYTLTADISSLLGQSGNIYFELADWGSPDPGWGGDGYDTTVEFANIAGITPVPEPTTLFLLSLSLLGLAVLRKRH